MAGEPILESARLRLRPQRIGDAEALFEAYGDAELMHYWSSGPHADVVDTRDYLAARLDKSDWRGWAITLTDDDRAIGTVAAGERRSGVTEIGYMLVRSAWGHGYAREAVSRVIDLLVREEGHRKIFADTDPDNAASNALLASLGFHREGLLRAEWETHIGVRDTVAWGLLADEWTSR
ncbi:GCN5 family acetyltransferase [Sphingomonas sp. Leaf357]|uniref:GNAT family N-acetyltransferase n=1 Tax=Sphingomonas sp. Leaf357 TaxID=1736350 RepID=UPI0006FBFDF5|nr:GNAT family N-acetyltransferase [Sphingomonas sp. Leaf357]KQS04083.1 GCN5 family acetyltransferase [Sphingomonas sp. Leaf357]